MKHTLILCALFLIFISCKDDPEPEPQELLINTDMEAGGTTPNAWWGVERSVYTTEWTSEEASSGSKSLKISATQADDVNFAFWSQTYYGEIPVGKDVMLSIKIKCKQVSGDGISIAIRGDNATSINRTAAQFSSSYGINPISGDFDWTTYKVRLNGIKDDIKSLTVYVILNNKATGTVYFDDASLKTL